MIKGRLSIIGDMVVDGEELTGVFVKCSRDELKKGCGDLFCEEVEIVASQPQDSTDEFPLVRCNTVCAAYSVLNGEACKICKIHG